MKQTILTLFFCMAALAQQPRIATVKVEVNADSSEPTKERVQSYLERELRKLGDVEVSPAANATLVAIPCTLKAADGTPVGNFAISILLTVKWGPQDGELERVSILDHNLWYGTTARLEELCQRIIADLDINVLKLFRNYQQQSQRRLDLSPARPAVTSH